MLGAAVWPHTGKLNNKIVHNSTENFLCNLSDFFSDDARSCLWIVFTNSVFQVPPQKIVSGVEIFGIGWSDLTWNEPVPWEVMPEVFDKWGTISFQTTTWNRTLEYLRHNFSWDKPISHQTDNPWLSYSQDPNPPVYFLREYLKDKVFENNPQTREDIIRKEIRQIVQEILNRVMDNFIVRVTGVLSYNSGVHETNIVVITEKV